MEASTILLAFNNIYITIFALFCFKLLIKVSLALLTHFYIVRGNRKEAARIAEEIYGISQGSWADRSPLHDAAFHGRLLTIKTLIAQGFNVNLLTIDRVSPLHEACLGGHVACAKALLENGAYVNIVTVDGISPLYNACSCGSVACVSMLLDYRADPELETQLVCPLHEAIIKGHRECAEILIAHGVDINKEVQHIGSPLYVACVHQRIDCVKKLLDLGADVHIGKLSDTPLHAAARKSSEEIVKLLIDYGANVKQKNMDGKYPIELAAPRSHVEQALLFAEGPATLSQLCRLCIRKILGASCLQSVTRLNLPERLEDFLLYREDVTSTWLFCLCTVVCLPSWCQQERMDAGGVNGSSGQSQDFRGQSSLIYSSNPLMSDFVSDWSLMHDASIHGRTLALNKLISQGCSVNLITTDHVSPLHEACLGGHPACVSALLKHGAQVNIPNIDWQTPIFNACVSGNATCVNLLLEHGASPHAACDVASPIHEAAKRGHTKCVESLTSAGVSVQQYVKHLGSPLYVACENQRVDTAKKLLEFGASANTGKDLDSPLHVAARSANSDLVNLLIDFGADTQSKNSEGKRPAELVPPHCTLKQVFQNREGPLSLMQICRLCIRKCFRPKQHDRICDLLIPDALKQFILYR
ncbi:ankyrin repeat and SOCS box protein 11-like [Discoglossus pictus]